MNAKSETNFFFPNKLDPMALERAKLQASKLVASYCSHMSSAAELGDLAMIRLILEKIELELPVEFLAAASPPSLPWTKLLDQESISCLVNGPLIVASMNGHLDVVQYLVNGLDADVYAKDTTTGAMPIHLASNYGHLPVVKFLLQVKPKLLEARSCCNGTPLCQAAMGRKLDVIKFLVENGANVEARGVYGRTPLHLACYASDTSLEVVKYLVEVAGANVRAIDTSPYEVMPIHVAAYYGHLPIVEYLLERQPDLLDVKSNALGLTPLKCASRQNQTDVAEFLREKLNALGRI